MTDAPQNFDQKLSDQPIFELPQCRAEILEFLERRRSNLAKLMQDPGPDAAQITQLITIAARVPDHRKLNPWRFVIFTEDARQDFGQHLGAAFAKAHPDLAVDRIIFESSRLMRAPLVIAVISEPKDCPRGTPKWEQSLSAGAVCFNLCLAAQALGFGAQWLTEWYSYDADVNQALGVVAGEQVAGYIYIGTVDTPPIERARPDIDTISRYWQGG